jgi:hypothetical protein
MNFRHRLQLLAAQLLVVHFNASLLLLIQVSTLHTHTMMRIVYINLILLCYCVNEAGGFSAVSSRPAKLGLAARRASLMQRSTAAVDIDEEASIPAALYAADPSDHRYSAKDWSHIVKTLPQSHIFRETRSPVITVTLWSTFVSIVHKVFLQKGLESVANRMCIPSLPHSMLVSALGLLLVFRTNSAYQRFAVSRLPCILPLNCAVFFAQY